MSQGQTERGVRVYTTDGVVEGTLRISEMLRTLDDLNIVTKSFVSVWDVRVDDTQWGFEDPMIAVHRRAILFVVESSAPPPRRSNSMGFTRAGVRLRLGEYVVEGFVHVPPGGTSMSRINQDNHPFLALTSASVSCGDEQFAAAFLAVNREHVLAAQPLESTPCDVDTDEATHAGVTLR